MIMQVVPPSIADLLLDNILLSLGILAVYFVIFLGLTYVSRRGHVGTITDHAVASRDLGWVVVTLTVYASVVSGVGLVGFPGSVYAVGTPFFTTLMVGFSFAACCIWYFGRRIWILGREHDFTTPGDLLGTYYQSDTVRAITVLASVLYNMAYIVGQLLAGGILVFVLTGGQVSQTGGMVLIAAIVAVHVILTGIRGIAHLDTLNGLVIVSLLVIFGGGIIAHAGGLASVFTSLGDLQAAHTTIPGQVGVFTPSHVLGLSFGLVLGAAVFAPHAWMRFYSARSRRTIPLIATGILVLTLFSHLIGTYLIGTYGLVHFPNIGNSDFASSLLAFEVLPLTIGVTFLIAILAAIISTTDSYIHALATTIMRDFVREIANEGTTNEQELSGNRVLTVLISIVGIALAMFYPGLITPLAVFAGGITLQLLPPLFGAIAWPRASTEAAIIAPTSGIALTFVWELGVLPNPVPVDLLPGLAVAFFLNCLLFVGISFATQPQPMERIEAFHGTIHDELRD